MRDDRAYVSAKVSVKAELVLAALDAKTGNSKIKSNLGCNFVVKVSRTARTKNPGRGSQI
jgi:hypothetical protein